MDCALSHFCEANQLSINYKKSIVVFGKGRKSRVVPIQDDVALLIRIYLAETGRTLTSEGPVFRAHGLDALVDAYVLSFEHGLQKPAAGLFATACSLIGRDPAEVVMVGDDRTADGGAAALGCEVRFVDHLPVSERPDGLRSLGLVPR